MIIEPPVQKSGDTLSFIGWTVRKEWDFVDNFDKCMAELETKNIWPRDTITNNELQRYVDDPTTLVRTPTGLSLTATETPDPGSPDPYISGMVTSRKTTDGHNFPPETMQNAFGYGRIRAMLKVPRGAGLWGAFWLLPLFRQWGSNPPVLPEIDIVEFINRAVNEFHTAVHTYDGGLGLTSSENTHRCPDDYDFTASFFWYTLDRTPERLCFYINDILIFAIPTPSDLQGPMFWLCNLAVGGDWVGPPDADTRFPASVDLARVEMWDYNGPGTVVDVPDPIAPADEDDPNRDVKARLIRLAREQQACIDSALRKQLEELS